MQGRDICGICDEVKLGGFQTDFVIDQDVVTIWKQVTAMQKVCSAYHFFVKHDLGINLKIIGS